MAMFAGLALMSLLGAQVAQANPHRTVVAIVGAKVVDVTQDAPDSATPRSTIIVQHGRIAAIGPVWRTPVPRGAQVINGHGKWVTPGLIDAHVHFFQSGNLYTRPDALDLNTQVPYAQEVARNQARLPTTFKVWLASGVTGVVDVGGPQWNFDVRALARRATAAPRLAVAGPLISMVDDRELDLGDPPIIKVSTPDEARALAGQQLKQQPDYIKSWFIHGPQDDLAAQTAMVQAAADTAHAAGVPFAVHATELDVAKAALRAGADYLVHSVEDQAVDDEFIALMLRNHAMYCPTLFVTMGYDLAFSGQWQPNEAEARLADPQVLAQMSGLDRLPPDMLPAYVRKALAEKAPVALSPIMAANLKRVWDAGIPVVMGTDAGNIGTLHGPAVFREMALMQQAGLSPAQVLRSATLNGARALRKQGELGAVQVGQLADLLVVDADPRTDLAVLSRPYRVIKGGVVFNPARLRQGIR